MVSSYVKFPLIFHWTEQNVPISEMIPDNINEITLRSDMTVTRVSAYPPHKAAEGRDVDMNGLDSVRKRKGKDAM